MLGRPKIKCLKYRTEEAIWYHYRIFGSTALHSTLGCGHWATLEDRCLFWGPLATHLWQFSCRLVSICTWTFKPVLPVALEACGILKGGDGMMGGAKAPITPCVSCGNSATPRTTGYHDSTPCPRPVNATETCLCLSTKPIYSFCYIKHLDSWANYLLLPNEKIF